ncbi:hypothetical protein BX600DRAFT_543433 [Xylariales sp. PMI_506]|nr:hypothetical protein BX600DRAFT_543433 [Xylariales sp. PMI_506]
MPALSYSAITEATTDVTKRYVYYSSSGTGGSGPSTAVVAIIVVIAVFVVLAMLICCCRLSATNARARAPPVPYKPAAPQLTYASNNNNDNNNPYAETLALPPPAYSPEWNNKAGANLPHQAVDPQRI